VMRERTDFFRGLMAAAEKGSQLPTAIAAAIRLLWRSTFLALPSVRYADSASRFSIVRFD
jgi:hypothetical protein